MTYARFLDAAKCHSYCYAPLGFRWAVFFGVIDGNNLFVVSRDPGAKQAYPALDDQPSGYWNEPAASAAVLDSEDWFHTGYIVECDDECYLYGRDRKQDMFISGSENVYPVEIQQVLCKHPAVLMCAVIGLPDAWWGEVSQACVMLRSGQSATEAELLMEKNP